MNFWDGFYKQAVTAELVHPSPLNNAAFNNARPVGPSVRPSAPNPSSYRRAGDPHGVRSGSTLFSGPTPGSAGVATKPMPTPPLQPSGFAHPPGTGGVFHSAPSIGKHLKTFGTGLLAAGAVAGAANLFRKRKANEEKKVG